MKKIFSGTFIVLLILLNLPVVKVLSISNRKNPSEKIYSRSGVSGFVVSYTHSVNKGRIHDYYTSLKNGDLILLRSVFVSYGAGIPEPEEIADCDFTVRPDGYELGGIDRQMRQFLMAVGVIAEHSICFCSQGEAQSAEFSEISKCSNEYFLKDCFPVQTSLVFKVKRVSVIRYFFTKKLEK